MKGKSRRQTTAVNNTCNSMTWDPDMKYFFSLLLPHPHIFVILVVLTSCHFSLRLKPFPSPESTRRALNSAANWKFSAAFLFGTAMNRGCLLCHSHQTMVHGVTPKSSYRGMSGTECAFDGRVDGDKSSCLLTIVTHSLRGSSPLTL